MQAKTLPDSHRAIDASWMSQALSLRQPGTQVASLQHLLLMGGAGTKLKVAVQYDANPHDLPEILWIKAGWEEHSALLEAAGSYAREAIFLGHLRPPGIRAPLAFHAAWTTAGAGLIVMEDLTERSADIWACPIARSVTDVEAVLDTLARLHARWWDSPELMALEHVDIPVRSNGPLSAWPRANGAERLREVLSGPRGEGLPDYVKAPERIERAFWAMVASLEMLKGGCLLHGDPHPGNCFTDADGGGGLYDWQTIARGPWAFDVAYHIVTSLTPDDRRREERRLLDRYRSKLSAFGAVGLPDDAAMWDLYRRHIAYPLLIWPTNHVSHQAEENIRALTERLGIAAADFGFFELWGC